MMAQFWEGDIINSVYDNGVSGKIENWIVSKTKVLALEMPNRVFHKLKYVIINKSKSTEHCESMKTVIKRFELLGKHVSELTLFQLVYWFM